MKKISAEIIADSVNESGNRITSYILTYPRFIHSELMTHRLFSRNSASSRAIPFEKMVKMVEEDPFVPIAWQKDHKGMQGNQYINVSSTEFNGGPELYWRQAAISAINMAAKLNNNVGLTKQLCNRLLEPFMWHTVLVTATEYDNFFELRCPQYFGKFKSWKDASNLGGVTYETPLIFRMNDSQAEIHIQALAEAMWDAMNESVPKQLKAGEWHIPFGDKIDLTSLRGDWITLSKLGKSEIDIKVKIATARAARLSYMTFDGEINYEKDIQLHDHLLKSKHLSPFEHCARAMSENELFSYAHSFPIRGGCDYDIGWCNNFKGFIQYRYLLENKKHERI